jgi:isocitrate dehydrogenase
MVIFRENTEDIYAGIEFAAGSDEALEILKFLKRKFPKRYDKIRFNDKKKGKEYLKIAKLKDQKTRNDAFDRALG